MMGYIDKLLISKEVFSEKPDNPMNLLNSVNRNTVRDDMDGTFLSQDFSITDNPIEEEYFSKIPNEDKNKINNSHHASHVLINISN